MLAEKLKRVEHIKAGILNAQECRTADHSSLPLESHIESYMQHLKAKTIRGRKISEGHRSNVQRQLKILLKDCSFKRLRDITRDALEKWMNWAEESDMGARTRNTYRAAIIAFCNWCVETDRMAANPLARLCKADEHADTRKQRRALTEAELKLLFRTAHLRPLAEYGRQTIRIPKEKRKGRRSWYQDGDHAAHNGVQRDPEQQHCHCDLKVIRVQTAHNDKEIAPHPEEHPHIQQTTENDHHATHPADTGAEFIFEKLRDGHHTGLAKRVDAKTGYPNEQHRDRKKDPRRCTGKTLVVAVLGGVHTGDDAKLTGCQRCDTEIDIQLAAGNQKLIDLGNISADHDTDNYHTRI